LDQYLIAQPYHCPTNRVYNSNIIATDIDLLRGADIIESKKLALWTILTFRWPSLANYLEEYPDMIKYIGKGKKEDLQGINILENLQRLFLNPNVCDVIQGNGIGTALDERAIRDLLGLRTSDDSCTNNLSCYYYI
jgi:hypothetical protein